MVYKARHPPGSGWHWVKHAPPGVLSEWDALAPWDTQGATDCPHGYSTPGTCQANGGGCGTPAPARHDTGAYDR